MNNKSTIPEHCMQLIAKVAVYNERLAVLKARLAAETENLNKLNDMIGECVLTGYYLKFGSAYHLITDDNEMDIMASLEQKVVDANAGVQLLNQEIRATQSEIDVSSSMLNNQLGGLVRV